MSVKHTDSQNAMLRAASLRDDRCLVLPPTLKAGAAQKVADKLIAEGLVKEIKAKGEAPVWRRDQESGGAFVLKLTASGVKAIASLLNPMAISETIAVPVDPVGSLPKPPGSPPSIVPISEIGKAAPREGSKLALVLSLLRRSEGATIQALTEATGWLPHTTRAALTGVRKRGYAVALERGDEGESVYRLGKVIQEEVPSEDEGKQIAPPRRKAAERQAA
jgi:Protein of unknown function (DUF3489)